MNPRLPIRQAVCMSRSERTWRGFLYPRLINLVIQHQKRNPKMDVLISGDTPPSALATSVESDLLISLTDSPSSRPLTTAALSSAMIATTKINEPAVRMLTTYVPKDCRRKCFSLYLV